MKKMWKQITGLALLLCMVITCALMSACVTPTPGPGPDDNPPPDITKPKPGKPEEPDDGTTTYEITVVKPDNTPVAGVQLKICTLDENGVEQNCRMFITDADGKISAKLTTADYHVDIVGGIPTGFSKGNNDGWLTATEGSKFTIKLTEATASVS